MLCSLSITWVWWCWVSENPGISEKLVLPSTRASETLCEWPDADTQRHDTLLFLLMCAELEKAWRGGGGSVAGPTTALQKYISSMISGLR